MRYTTRRGTTAQQGSSSGWGRTPLEARTCPECGKRVTLDCPGSWENTELTPDGKVASVSVRHWPRCPS